MCALTNIWWLTHFIPLSKDPKIRSAGRSACSLSPQFDCFSINSKNWDIKKQYCCHVWLSGIPEMASNWPHLPQTRLILDLLRLVFSHFGSLIFKKSPRSVPFGPIWLNLRPTLTFLLPMLSYDSWFWSDVF